MICMYLLDWQRYCFVVQRHVQPMCCAIIQRTCIQAWVPNNVWSMELSRIRTTQSNSLPFVKSTLQNNFGNTMYCLWKDRTTSHQKNVKSQMQAKSVHEPPESAIWKSATLRSIFQWLAVGLLESMLGPPMLGPPFPYYSPTPKRKNIWEDYGNGGPIIEGHYKCYVSGDICHFYVPGGLPHQQVQEWFRALEPASNNHRFLSVVQTKLK